MTGTIDHESGGVRWSLRPDLLERHAELFGADGIRLAEWLADGRAALVKHSRRRQVYRVSLPGLDFHLKCHAGAGITSWLQRLIRPCQARIEFDRAAFLAALRVPALEALGVGERRRGGPSYLLTRTVPHAQPLSDFFEGGL